MYSHRMLFSLFLCYESHIDLVSRKFLKTYFLGFSQRLLCIACDAFTFMFYQVVYCLFDLNFVFKYRLGLVLEDFSEGFSSIVNG